MLQYLLLNRKSCKKVQRDKPRLQRPAVLKTLMTTGFLSCSKVATFGSECEEACGDSTFNISGYHSRRHQLDVRGYQLWQGLVRAEF